MMMDEFAEPAVGPEASRRALGRRCGEVVVASRKVVIYLSATSWGTGRETRVFWGGKADIFEKVYEAQLTGEALCASNW